MSCESVRDHKAKSTVEIPNARKVVWAALGTAFPKCGSTLVSVRPDVGQFVHVIGGTGALKEALPRKLPYDGLLCNHGCRKIVAALMRTVKA
jgi:hypothetical protein